MHQARLCDAFCLPAARSSQHKIKTVTFVYFAFRPYPSAVLVHDTLNGCQADSGPLKVICAVKTLKDAERCFLH